jgi:hypothetical protein
MKSNCNYIFEKILLLPNFMQKKIIYYNIWNYLQINDKKTSAQALSKIPPFKDFNIICTLFNKFSYNEFIQIDIDHFNYIQSNLNIQI